MLILDGLKAAADAYETFVKGLMDANDAGERPLSAINAQISLRDTEGVCELGYTVASNVFTTYNRKNILSGLIGQTPLSVFVVVDVVYKGWESDGQLAASGVVAQTSEKLVDLERLGDVVIGACVQRFHLVRPPRATGHDDDGACKSQGGCCMRYTRTHSPGWLRASG